MTDFKVSDNERKERLSHLLSEREKRISSLNKFFRSLLRKSIEELHIEVKNEPADIWLERDTALLQSPSSSRVPLTSSTHHSVSRSSRHRLADEHYDIEASVLGFGFRGDDRIIDGVKVLINEEVPIDGKIPTSISSQNDKLRAQEWIKLVVGQTLIVLPPLAVS